MLKRERWAGHDHPAAPVTVTNILFTDLFWLLAPCYHHPAACAITQGYLNDKLLEKNCNIFSSILLATWLTWSPS